MCFHHHDSAVKIDMIQYKMLLPLRTDIEKLSGYKFHQFAELFVWYMAAIVCKNTSACPCQPDLCCIRRKLPLADMHMDRFVILV